MTGLDRKALRLVQPDLNALSQVVQEWAMARGLNWDPFCAHRVVPAWEQTVRDHTDIEILDTNERSLAVADALIVHAFDDGSAMIGWLTSAVLKRAHLVPVLFLAHENETLSKALLGLQQRHPLLSFGSFADDLDIFRVSQTWLDKVEDRIADGPRRRRTLEGIWEPMAISLLAKWRNADDELRYDITEATGLAQPWLEELLTEPLLVADLPSHSLAVMIERLGVDASGGPLAEQARVLFDDVEIQAWSYWARDKSRAYAHAVLDAALSDRKDGRVARELQYFGQPGAWDRFATQWRTGPQAK
jgi:hypothetical protein